MNSDLRSGHNIWGNGRFLSKTANIWYGEEEKVWNEEEIISKNGFYQQQKIVRICLPESSS